MTIIKSILNRKNLSEATQKELIRISETLFSQAIGQHPRCTFFAHDGIDLLIKEIKSIANFFNPRIEGCDHNPFDQHYWLALYIDKKPAIIDPIFGYIGLEEFAKEKLDNVHLRYYKEKGVIPTKDDIRIKTLSL